MTKHANVFRMLLSSFPFITIFSHEPAGMMVDLKSNGGNGYSSLAGNLPSHISIFGGDEGGGGRALSAGAHEAVMSLEDTAAAVAGPIAMEDSKSSLAWANLPSHISIFGSNSGEDDETAAERARLQAPQYAHGAGGEL